MTEEQRAKINKAVADSLARHFGDSIFPADFSTATDAAPDPEPMTLEKLQAAIAELAPLPPDPLNGAVALYYADGMEADAKLLAAEYDHGPYPRGLSISPRWWLPAGTIWGMKPAEGFGVEICVIIGPETKKVG
jgi:hypothetical protein